MALSNSTPLRALVRVLSRSKSLNELSEGGLVEAGQTWRSFAALPSRQHDSDSDAASDAPLPSEPPDGTQDFLLIPVIQI